MQTDLDLAAVSVLATNKRHLSLPRIMPFEPEPADEPQLSEANHKDTQHT